MWVPALGLAIFVQAIHCGNSSACGQPYMESCIDIAAPGDSLEPRNALLRWGATLPISKVDAFPFKKASIDKLTAC